MKLQNIGDKEKRLKAFTQKNATFKRMTIRLTADFSTAVEASGNDIFIELKQGNFQHKILHPAFQDWGETIFNETKLKGILKDKF